MCLHINPTSSVVAQRLHTSETVQPHRAPHGPRPALPRSPSRPSQLFLPHPFFSSASVPTLPRREWQLVLHKPISKTAMENEDGVWVRCWSSWASIIPRLCDPFLSHYSSPLRHVKCMRACHFLSLTCFFPRAPNLTRGSSRVLPHFQAHCRWWALSVHHSTTFFSQKDALAVLRYVLLFFSH